MTPSVNRAEEKSTIISPANILVATDLDDLELLTPFIVAQAIRSGALVTLVHAVEPNDYVAIHPAADAYTCEEAQLRAEEVLKAKKKELEVRGISCSYYVTCGFANDVLLNRIKISAATRLLMTSHGRGKVGQFLMGSVAKQILGSCRIPVFIVPRDCPERQGHYTPKLILHPVSLHGDYLATAEIAEKIAKKYEANLSLLHVFTGDSKERQSKLNWANDLLVQIAPEFIDYDAPNSIDLGPSIGTTTKFGDLVQEIGKEASRNDADWIVMGVSDDSGIVPLRDCFAYRVMATSQCPVLAIWHRAEPQSAGAMENEHLLANV